jgi:hypothetical protein
MRKSYVLVYTSALAENHTSITNVLDELDPQGDWHVPMQHCLFFTSSRTAQELADSIERKIGIGPGKLFLITEVSKNKQGRLGERGWKVLNNPDNPRAQ